MHHDATSGPLGDVLRLGQTGVRPMQPAAGPAWIPPAEPSQERCAQPFPPVPSGNLPGENNLAPAVFKPSQHVATLKNSRPRLNFTRRHVNFTRRRVNNTQQRLNFTRERLNFTQRRLNNMRGRTNNTQRRAKITQRRLDCTWQPLADSRKPALIRHRNLLHGNILPAEAGQTLSRS